MAIQINSIEEYNNLQKDMNTFNKIKSVSFGYDFNEKINIFPKSAISIRFEFYYNQPLPSLQNTNIKKIIFGNYYEQPLQSLLNTNIEIIIFGRDYNQPLPPLQNTKIKYIKFGVLYNQTLPSLQNTNIKKIVFGFYYNQPLPDLQYAKIKAIIFGIWDSAKPILKTSFLYSPFSHKIKNATYLQKIIIKKESYNIKKYKNQIFNIMETRNAYIIKKILTPYLKYIIYNNIYIPVEIYNYIYFNYNFTYAN